MIEIRVRTGYIADLARKLSELGIHHILSIDAVEDPAVVTAAHSIVASPVTLGQVVDEMLKLKEVSSVTVIPRRTKA